MSPQLLLAQMTGNDPKRGDFTFLKNVPTTPNFRFFSPFVPLWRIYFDFKVPFGMSPQPEEKRESFFLLYVYLYMIIQCFLGKIEPSPILIECFIVY